MKRRPFRFPLLVERLEDRNAPSDKLCAILAGLNQPLAALPDATGGGAAFFVAGR